MVNFLICFDSDAGGARNVVTMYVRRTPPTTFNNTGHNILPETAKSPADSTIPVPSATNKPETIFVNVVVAVTKRIFLPTYPNIADMPPTNNKAQSNGTELNADNAIETRSIANPLKNCCCDIILIIK